MKHLKIFFLTIVCLLAGASALTWQRNERDYALTEAIGRNDITKVQKLLDAGANPNAPWSGYDFKATLYRLLGRDPFNDHSPDRDNYRILYFTSNPQIRRILIEQGARP